MSVSEEFAQKLADKIVSHTYGEFTSEELVLLQQMMCSDVLLKALGRTFFYVEMCKNEALSIDLGTADGLAKIAKVQGQAVGATEVVQGLLRLITEQEEKEEDDGSTQSSLN